MIDPSIREKIWLLPASDVNEEQGVAALVADAGLSPITARLLYRRGYKTASAVRRFLSCEDTLLHSPFLMKDMERAEQRIRTAIEQRERIVIYGDYDVDGVTAVSLLYLYIAGEGGNVEYYIPSRSGEGYGLSTLAIDRFREDGVTLIVTVDTGITANEEAAHAASLEIDMVITDHHECRMPLPEAVAVVNPHRPDCEYPFKELAGVGVVFKLVAALESRAACRRGEKEIDGVRRAYRKYADLAAIGTIADVMPIADENRVLVKEGLLQIADTDRAGLAALIEEASLGNRAAGDARPVRRKKITASFIGFGLAPRLNAAGRMSEASRAVELLLADNGRDASALAVELCEINRARQVEENRIAEEAYARIERDFDLSETHVIVLEDDAWRQGIIGIVASRITERYGRPSILISFDGSVNGFDSPDDLGKGSGRSVKGMNLVEALTDSEDLLVKFGGHELAAGLTVRRDRIDDFRRRINAYAAKHLPKGGATISLSADLELRLPEATLALAEEISRLEPFGVSNPMPQFVMRDLRIERISELGGGKHLKLTVSDGDMSLYALAFSTPRSALGFREGDRIDLLCTLDINEYQSIRSVQLIVQDIKPSAHFEGEYLAARARYAEIRAGATFTSAEEVLPTRDLFARVYTAIRREFRQGNSVFRERDLLSLVNVGATRPINYICLKYIIEIFHELQICGVEELEEGVYRFDVYFHSGKTNIEKSSILKRLRSRCRNEK
ncbi:MAG: single-stranded-DNA-specific exonuclease RecJ [Ruminococcaceae bacterium]|nr:single-stranded-DNA-specific exonuclease RecJ [Oscillospiraceae bacterium]